MSDERGFDQELAAVATHVDAQVGNVVQILRKGSHSTAKQTTTAPVPKTVTEPAESVPENSESADASVVPNSRRRQKTPREKPGIETKPQLENVTTRLPIDTNQRLTEAALRQKLNKRKPDSRQEIIDEAIRGWLGRNGYQA